MILHLKIIHMTERTGSSPTMLSAVCRPPHFDSWRTDIQEEARRWLIKNIEAQSRIHEILHWIKVWGGVREPVVQPATLHHQEVTHQMSKYFSWGLTLHFSWLGKDYDHISCCMQLSCLTSIFLAPLQVCWCCHKARDTHGLKKRTCLLLTSSTMYMYTMAKMFTLCWVKAPPRHQEEDSGLPRPCTYSKH